MAHMRFIQRAAVAALALAISACATQWDRPGSTEEDLASDRAFCENAAENEFAGMEEGRLQGWATALDRRGAFERCMMAHGWGIKA
jgi:hypothetical protein